MKDIVYTEFSSLEGIREITLEDAEEKPSDKLFVFCPKGDCSQSLLDYLNNNLTVDEETYLVGCIAFNSEFEDCGKNDEWGTFKIDENLKKTIAKKTGLSEEKIGVFYLD